MDEVDSMEGKKDKQCKQTDGNPKEKNARDKKALS